jgi:hypothetical protein
VTVVAEFRVPCPQGIRLRGRVHERGPRVARNRGDRLLPVCLILGPVFVLGFRASAGICLRNGVRLTVNSSSVT